MKKHNIEGAFTFKNEHIDENSVEYEMRDSSGYSIPHTPDELNLIYSMRARNVLDAKRIEAIYKTHTDSQHLRTAPCSPLTTDCVSSHWSYTKEETIVSPRLSLGNIPAFNQNMTIRLHGTLYYRLLFPGK